MAVTRSDPLRLETRYRIDNTMVRAFRWQPSSVLRPKKSLSIHLEPHLTLLYAFVEVILDGRQICAEAKGLFLFVGKRNICLSKLNP